MRDLFLLDPSIVFLNHGSFGACPRVVFERYQHWQAVLEHQPVLFFRRYNDEYSTARAALGQYLGTQAENLLFVHNATNGVNVAAKSLRLQVGDEILTADHEYGALNLMWGYLQAEKGLNIVIQELPDMLNDPDEVVEKLWEGVTERTRVIYLSHITSPTALILPVEKICQRARAEGILTIIDGAHAPGQVSLNLDQLGADFYTGNCHKWLCAPKGAAFLYVRPEHHDQVIPPIISWGWDGETMFERTRMQGTQDISAYLTVPDAIRFQEEHNWDAVRIQCHDLAIETMERINSLTGCAPLATPEFFGQMAAARLPEGCDGVQLKSRLYDDFHIEIPITEHKGQYLIRVSIQGYNTREDADALLDALEDLL